MFHYSNLGWFGEALRRLADLNGMVPEAGDEPEAFEFSHDRFERDLNAVGNGAFGYAAERWEEHVAEAVNATAAASAELAHWRRGE